jgi:hypothetical protein
MAINMNKANRDGEFFFQSSDSPNEVSVFCSLVDLQPIRIGTLHSSQVVTANGDLTFRNVKE